MSKTTIIGLYGPAGSGKDTFAKFLKRNIKKEGGISHIIAFSDQLYIEVAEAFSVTVSMLQDREAKEIPNSLLTAGNCKDHIFKGLLLSDREITTEQPISPRKLLQLWGTEYRRSQDEEYWIKLTKLKINELQAKNPGCTILITGVRSTNEVDFIRNLDPDNTLLVSVENVRTKKVNAHSTEQNFASFTPDHTVVNNAKFKDLKALSKIFHDEIFSDITYEKHRISSKPRM